MNDPYSRPEMDKIDGRAQLEKQYDLVRWWDGCLID
jgi:hypothetical protein